MESDPQVQELIEKFITVSEEMKKSNTSIDTLVKELSTKPSQPEMNDLSINLLAVNKSLGGLADILRQQGQKGQDANGKSSDSDDADAAKEQNKQAVDELAGAKESKQKEDDRKAVEEERKTTKELLITQKETTEVLLTANDYLKQLASLTERNTKLLEDQRAGKRTEDETLAHVISGTIKTALSSGTDLLSSSFDTGGSIRGGSSGLFTGAGKLVQGLAGIGSIVTGGIGGAYEQTAGGGLKSWNRQRKLKSYESQMNDEKALLSAQQAKLEDMKSEGADKKDILTQLKVVRDKKRSIRDIGDEYGQLFGEESVYQRGKRSKTFRGFSDDDKDDLASQVGGNFYSRATDDLKWVGRKDRKDLKEPKSPQIGNLASILGIGSLSDISSESSGGIFGGGGGGSSAKDIMEYRVQSATNPSTYGQYVGGIFDQLRKLNRYLVDERSLEGKSGTGEGGDESGGMLSNISSFLGSGLKKLGGLIGRAASTIGRGLGSVGSLLGSDVGALAGSGLAGGAAVAAGSVAAAAGGLYIGNKIAESTGMADNGTSVGDITAGVGSALTGEGFMKGLETRQIARKQSSDREKQREAQIKATNEAHENRTPVGAWLNFTKEEMAVMNQEEIDRLGSVFAAMSNNEPGAEPAYWSYKKQLLQIAKQRTTQMLSDKQAVKSLGGGGSDLDVQSGESAGNGGRSPESSRSEVGLSSVAGTVESAQDKFNMMSIQAKLIAMEMMKMQRTPEYVDQQEQFYKKQGYATAEVLG